MEKRKVDLQPSTSLDSAQTAQTASPSAHVGSSNPHRVDPNAAKLAIKEALAPLGPAQLARVQEQLRQSRLARQQQPLAGFEVSSQPCCPCQDPSPCQHPSTACQPQLQDPSMGSSEVACTLLVQQVAAALAKGQLSSHDIMRVLNTLDPSVLRTPPQHQQQHQLRMPQHHPQHQDALWAQQQHQRTGMLSAPTAIPLPPMAFGSSLLPPAVASVPRQRLRTPAASVAAPYIAVLNNLQLPPAALAAHAAAATAAAAVAKARHPGSSRSKGKRSNRKARFQLSRLVGSVSTASDAAGHMSLDDHAADLQVCERDGRMLVMSTMAGLLSCTAAAVGSPLTCTAGLVCDVTQRHPCAVCWGYFTNSVSMLGLLRERQFHRSHLFVLSTRPVHMLPTKVCAALLCRPAGCRAGHGSLPAAGAHSHRGPAVCAGRPCWRFCYAGQLGAPCKPFFSTLHTRRLCHGRCRGAACRVHLW